jgi:hypothetical protein
MLFGNTLSPKNALHPKRAKRAVGGKKMRLVSEAH